MSDQLKTIFIVTGPVKECGIYQYADSMLEVLKQSKRYNYELVATDSPFDLVAKVAKERPYAVIYNHNGVTLPMQNNHLTHEIKKYCDKQLMITGHEFDSKFDNIESYIYTDPRVPHRDNNYPGLLPITYYDDIQYSPRKADEPIRIGTGGIFNVIKSTEFIVEYVWNQFRNTDQKVILNLHLSTGAFVDAKGEYKRYFMDQCKHINSENFEIQINTDFLSKKDLIKWLNSNDINIYWYNTNSKYGVSASINHAIAAKKPFGVNNSNFLNHVRYPFNDLTQKSIMDIIDGGIKPFETLYSLWEPQRFIDYYESIIDEI
jgi:hypothetical protein